METSRRELLALGTAAALSIVPGLSNAAEPPQVRKKKRVVRIAHVTDIHVQPEREAALGMERCLDHCQSQNPDIIFFGGDYVMDCLGADLDRVKSQWDIFDRVLKANISVPAVHCIGNHDVWGWNDVTKYCNEPMYGKRFAMDRLFMAKPYYSFDRSGWHFIVLDSTHARRGNGYIGKLDTEQFEWLSADLSRTPKDRPVLVMSHIPILSVCAYFDGHNEKMGDWHVPGAWMHIDARRIKDLFAKHSNVQVCISGHIHLVDRLRYLGIPYYCNGAASGAWWAGPYQEFGNGYGLVDLYSDGTVENKYVEFGWTARP